MTEVELHGIEDNSRGIGCLTEALKGNTHVKELHLYANTRLSEERMDQTSVGYLAELMKTNNTMEEIGLYEYEKSWHGLVKLSKLFENPRFEILRLHGNIMNNGKSRLYFSTELFF